MTQEEILSLLYKKDEKAYTILYDMYSKSLFAIIFNLVKEREEAEDILQEVFVKIWNGPGCGRCPARRRRGASA